MGSYGTNGNLELSKLVENLGHVGTVTKATFPVEVTVDGNKFKVQSTGKVEKANGITISESELKLMLNDEETLTATLTDGVTGTIMWETSDENKVTVANGTVKVIAEGTSPVTITASVTDATTSSKYEATCTVKIIQKITAISATDLSLGNGSTEALEVTTTPNTGLIEELTYTPEDDTIATVNENGEVTGRAVGTTKITIAGKVSTNVKTTCNVTVTKAPVSVTAAQIAANPSRYYGQEVLNYTKGGTYRIFYVDAKTTENPNGYFGDIGENEQYHLYLKADYDNNRKMQCTLYDTTNNPETLVKKMNPDWAKITNRGNVSTNNWKDNEKAAAWLCMPTKEENKTTGLWKEYFESDKADYVIGSPSIEMYVKSYNQVSHNINNYVLGAIYRDHSNIRVMDTYRTQGYIYTINGEKSTISTSDYQTGSDTLDYKGYHSMYCGVEVNNVGTKGEYYYWISSPTACHAVQLCFVSSYNASLSISEYYRERVFCPIVSLKSDFLPQILE